MFVLYDTIYLTIKKYLLLESGAQKSFWLLCRTVHYLNGSQSKMHERTKMHEGTKLHECTKMHEDKIARR